MKSKQQKVAVAMGFVAVAVCLALPFMAKKKFPYSGVWRGKIVSSRGSHFEATLSFYENGSCSYTLAGTEGKTDYGCSYHMKGKTALIRTHFNQQKHGEHFIAYNLLEITPVNNGNTLNFQAIKTDYEDTKTGEQKTINFRKEIVKLKKMR